MMPTSHYLKSFVVLSLLAVFILPAYVYFYIAPKYETFIVANKEREAVRIAGHIVSMLLKDTKKIEGGTAAEFLSRHDRFIREEFQIEKIKLFLPDGTIVFSSNGEEIGAVNSKAYFFDKVAKGNNVTKVVKKNTLSLEDYIMSRDVVETYIPIMQKNIFSGAFELYFDITEARHYFQALMNRTYLVILAISVALVLAIVVGAVRAGNSMKERRQFEAKLFDQSITDELTGLLNRRGFFLMAEQHEQLARRRGERFALLFADMDGLKEINDSLGHEKGDQALVELSRVLKTAFREADIISRLGGDEFAVLLTSVTELESELSIRRRIERSIREFNSRSTGTYELAVSVGVALYDPEPGCSLDHLMAEADNRMYEEKELRKKAGRSPSPYPHVVTRAAA